MCIQVMFKSVSWKFYRFELIQTMDGWMDGWMDETSDVSRDDCGRLRTMRESEVENATSFLRHPNVRESSDVSAKRGFLEGKGLTREEIDEAFRRVGESGGSSSASAAFDGNRNGGVMTTKQPASSSTYGFFGSLARLVAVSGAAYLAYPSARAALERAANRLADRAAANQKNKTTDDGRGVVVQKSPEVTGTSMSPGEPIAATPESFAAARAAELAAERAERATEEAKSLREEIKREVSTTLRESISDVKKLLEAELKAEMRELKETLHTELATRETTSPQSYVSREVESSKLREWPLATSPQGSESGESLVYSPPKPARQHPAASDEFTLNNAVRETSSQVSVGDSPRMNGKRTLDDPPHPSNFMDILQMIENGQTPPGIKDIDDAPPNPNASIPRSSGSRPGKPWDAKRGGEDDDGEVTQVPIVKRVAGQSESPSSPWTPPPAPSLSSVMSISKTSPRRSVDQKVEGNANVNGRLEI